MTEQPVQPDRCGWCGWVIEARDHMFGRDWFHVWAGGERQACEDGLEHATHPDDLDAVELAQATARDHVKTVYGLGDRHRGDWVYYEVVPALVRGEEIPAPPGRPSAEKTQTMIRAVTRILATGRKHLTRHEGTARENADGSWAVDCLCGAVCAERMLPAGIDVAFAGHLANNMVPDELVLSREVQRIPRPVSHG